MISFGVKSNIDQVAKAFDKMARDQVPFATSLALNRTAQLARQTLRTHMASVFDRPTPYTLNSLYTINSTKRRLIARVEHKTGGKGTPASKYLRPEIEGGTRRQKASERIIADLAGVPNGVYVPGPGAKLDSYGNVSGSFIRQILAQLRGTSVKKKVGYFVVRRGNSRGIAAGVYQRTSTRIVPVLWVIPRATYQKRYDMEGVVKRVTNAEFGRQFAAAMDYALATAKVKL